MRTQGWRSGCLFLCLDFMYGHVYIHLCRRMHVPVYRHMSGRAYMRMAIRPHASVVRHAHRHMQRWVDSDRARTSLTGLGLNIYRQNSQQRRRGTGAETWHHKLGTETGYPDNDPRAIGTETGMADWGTDTRDRGRCARQPPRHRRRSGHNYIGNNYIGNNYIGHDNIGHNYIGHNYVGHN